MVPFKNQEPQFLQVWTVDRGKLLCRLVPPFFPESSSIVSLLVTMLTVLKKIPKPS